MKALKLLILLPLVALSLSVSSAFAVDGINDNDHAALAKHYENLAKEAEVKLHENKELLVEYETHPYYYGRQGQDFQSHTSANIHEYEEVLEENLNNADLHKRMTAEQDSSINKAKINLDHGSTAVR